MVNKNFSFTRFFSSGFRSFLCLVILSAAVKSGFSQQTDFQFWPQVQVGYNLSAKFKISLEEEVRLRENASQIKKELTDLGITYKVNKFLRLCVKYRLELNYRNPDTRAWQSGLYGDILLRGKLQRFQFDYRMRFQSAKIESISEVSSLNQLLTNRHKAGVSYDIKGIPLVPEIEAEIFIPISKQDPLIIEEYRLWAGLAYNINKKNEISLKFGVQQEVNVKDPWRAYILGVGYSLDIN
jgi:hypothetical protein